MLVVARALQGIGVGGEWGGVVLLAGESADVRRRGFAMSWPQFGGAAGLLLANAAVALMASWTNESAFLEWGWRIPFLASLGLIAVGLYIRSEVPESPVFVRLQAGNYLHRNPLGEVVRRNWREIVLLTLIDLMAMLSRIVAGVKTLLRPGRFEQDLDAELRAFLEAAVEQKMREGLSAEAATRAARMELGSPEAVKDRVRDVGWESAVESLYRDAQYAIRSLRRSPGFTAVALLTISLGIGANTAIFSVANSLLLRTVPIADPQRLVTLSSADDLAQRRAAKWSYATWRAIQQRTHAFDGACAWSALPLNLAQRGESQPVSALFASG